MSAYDASGNRALRRIERQLERIADLMEAAAPLPQVRRAEALALEREEILLKQLRALADRERFG